MWDWEAMNHNICFQSFDSSVAIGRIIFLRSGLYLSPSLTAYSVYAPHSEKLSVRELNPYDFCFLCVSWKEAV